MYRHVKAAAEWERDNHDYGNRTYKLEFKTEAKRIGSRDVALVMGVPYASYVEKMGLSNIDKAAKMAEEAILREFESR